MCMSTHTYTYTHKHTCIYSHMQTHMQTYKPHVHTCTHMCARTHECINTDNKVFEGYNFSPVSLPWDNNVFSELLKAKPVRVHKKDDLLWKNGSSLYHLNQRFSAGENQRKRMRCMPETSLTHLVRSFSLILDVSRQKTFSCLCVLSIAKQIWHISREAWLIQCLPMWCFHLRQVS